jgi:insulysin
MVETLTKVDILDFFIKYISPSSPHRSKLSIHMNSQIKPGTTTNFSVAASKVFLQDLKVAKIPVNEPQYHALSKAEPSVDTIISLWSQYLEKLPNVSAEKRNELLARVKELAKTHPTENTSSVEGKLKEGTIVIGDLPDFRKCLELSKPITPVIPLVVEEMSPDGMSSRL